MIIKNCYDDIVKISLVAGTEEKATKSEVLLYFLEKMKRENIIINSKLPFLWGKERVLYGNVEIVSAKEVFNIFMNKIQQNEKELAINKLNNKRKN